MTIKKALKKFPSLSVKEIAKMCKVKTASVRAMIWQLQNPEKASIYELARAEKEKQKRIDKRKAEGKPERNTTIKEAIETFPDLTDEQIATGLGYKKDSVYQARLRIKNDHPGLNKYCEENGIPSESVSHYWSKGKYFSVFSKRDAISVGIIEDMFKLRAGQHAPKYPTITYPPMSDGHLLVMDPADIHFNKLALVSETGERYDTGIAAQRVRDGIKGLLQKSRQFPIDHILFVLGNDILNADGPSNATTKGTRQDTDTLWHEALDVACSIMVESLEQLLTIAPVTVHFNPSNHDVILGTALANFVKAWFRNVPNISFDVSTRHRKYFIYGKNLIGTTHGDGPKSDQLFRLMADEQSDRWSECTRRSFYTHHVHHKIAKDYGSLCVESLRSPSGPDGWHHRNGFIGTPKAMEAFIHHKDQGQIARFTHFF
jgi:hypothetical protein